MKKVINELVFTRTIKEKLSTWLAGQLKVQSSVLPVIDIKEIAEFPLYRLVLKAEIQTRKIEQLRTGDAGPKGAKPDGQTADIDPWAIEIPEAEQTSDGKRTFDVQSSLVSTPCKNCAGAGKFPCPDCQGQKNVYCVTCRGDGKHECPKCRKSLKVHCQACGGIGKVYSASKQDYEDCAQCEGRGHNPCKDCNNGYIPCSVCGGSGRLPCAKCGESGSIECAACNGKGNLVSGSAVEISSCRAEEKLELPNPDIPLKILNEEFPAVSFSAEKPDEINVANEFSSQIEALEKKINVPPGARIVSKTVYREKKMFYHISYSIAGIENVSWFLSAGEKLIGQNSFLKNVYAALVSSLNKKLQTGDRAEVLKAAAEIENIPALKAEADKARKRLNSGVLSSIIAGSFAGAVLSMAVVYIFEFYSLRSSLHFKELILLSLAAVVLLSAVCGLAINLVKPSFADTGKKRAATAALIPAGICLLAVCAGVLFRVNPAKQLDEIQMKQEYNAYFPFGLRTLASPEDIDFLQKLIAKYSPSGIDLGPVKKDLAWLEEKQKTDDATMKKIELSAHNIENVSEIDKAKNMKVRSRRSRISIR